MFWNLFFLAIGGSLGAICRYDLNLRIGKRFSSPFPYGTLTINLVGSFLLGWSLGFETSMDLKNSLYSFFFDTGFLGAFTTFSTLKWQSLQLGLNKQWTVLSLYLGLTYSLGVAFAFLGFALAT